MSSYTRQLETVEVEDTDLLKALHGFEFFLSDSKTGWVAVIPSGFESNGASIPKFIQTLFGWDPTDPRWLQASFLHDALCGERGVQYGVYNTETGESKWLAWSEAADWFDSALRVKQAQEVCPELNRKAFVAAVKLYGKLFRKKASRLSRRVLPYPSE